MIDELVSIIMPVHNGAATIGESIESVQTQSYEKWELIIIDDCSTDGTKTVVEGYHDQRIRYHCLQRNCGVAQARNKGISMALGRYVAFLDSDDLWLPEKLAEQLAFMQQKRCGFSYTEYRQFVDTVSQIGHLIRIHDYVDYRGLLKGNEIGCLTVMIDRSIFPEIVMPSSRHEDYITWLNLLRTGKKAYGIHKDLARYRKSSKSLTGNKWRSLKWTWDVYRKSQNLSRRESLKNMYHYIIKGLKKHY